MSGADPWTVVGWLVVVIALIAPVAWWWITIKRTRAYRRFKEELGSKRDYNRRL